MALETLLALLEAISPDITFGDDIDIGDIHGDAEVKVKSEEDGEKARVEKDEILLNPEEFQGKEYARFQQFITKTKRQEGRVSRADKRGETRVIENADTTQYSGIISFFDDRISPRYMAILRSALYLRAISDNRDLSREFDIDGKKRDVAEKYGYEAYYMIHLTSSGYFDEEGYFQRLYYEFEDAPDPTQAFRDEFEEIIGEKLIATYVSSEDSNYDVKTDIKSGLARYFRHSPRAEFYDVRGLGDECRTTIEQSISELKEEYRHMQVENMTQIEEYVARIYPNSLREF